MGEQSAGLRMKSSPGSKIRSIALEVIRRVSRKPNPKLVKIHRSYTVEEVAGVCGVHRATVRNWIKNGLTTLDSGRPMLVLGSVLRSFLEKKRKRGKRPLKPGEIYCVKCREPRIPFGASADVEMKSANFFNLVGICEDCETIIYRRISLRKWHQSVGKLEVTLPKALEQLVNGNDPSLNCDLM